MRDKYSRVAILLTVMSFFVGTAASGQDLPIKVEIAVGPSSTVKNNEDFVVSTTIRNVGRDELRLWIWSCSYPEQWAADSAVVHIRSVPCLKNDTFQLEIEPGKTYERELEIYIDAEHYDSKPITFQLGFEPAVSDKLIIASRVWSNAITVNVAE